MDVSQAPKCPEVPRSASKCLEVPGKPTVYFISKILQKVDLAVLGGPRPQPVPGLGPARPSPPAAGHRRTQILQAVLNLQIICDTFTTKFSPPQMCKFCFGRTRHQQRIGTEHSWLLGSLPDRALPLPAVRNGTDRRRRPATQRDDGQAHTICNSSGGPRPPHRVNDR